MVGRQRLSPGDRGFLGTDLSGSHPISFRVRDALNRSSESNLDRDMAIKPLETILADKDVSLDSNEKMQCTTCHDPHSDANYKPDKVPHFWVKSTIEEVCLTCHELR